MCLENHIKKTFRSLAMVEEHMFEKLHREYIPILDHGQRVHVRDLMENLMENTFQSSVVVEERGARSACLENQVEIHIEIIFRSSIMNKERVFREPHGDAYHFLIVIEEHAMETCMENNMEDIFCTSSVDEERMLFQEDIIL